MKRKDFEVFHDDFSSRKSRRLDGELFPLMDEDRRAGVGEVIEESLLLEPHFSCSTSSLMQPNFLTTEAMPAVNEERALVLYNPPTMSTPLPKSPSSPSLSIILNSELIPGLRDHIFWQGNSRTMKLPEDDMATNVSTEELNNSLAVVPWVASQVPMTSQAEATDLSEPMEAEEVEMMDTEDSTTSSSATKAFAFVGMGRAAGMQHWQQQQQHCMAQPHLSSTTAPVTW